MCKRCPHDDVPYLAGLIVVAPWRGQGHDNVRSITGRCVGHHKGTVKLRTLRGSIFAFPEHAVLAYLPRV